MGSKQRAFFSRLSSTLVLWGIVAAAVYFSVPMLYLVLIEFLALVSVWEFFRIVDLPGKGSRGIVMVLVSGLYLALLFFAGYPEGPIPADKIMIIDGGFLSLLFIGSFLAEFRYTPQPGSSVARVTVTMFGFLWIPFLFGFVIKLLYLPGGSGLFTVLFLVVVTKFSDMGAYITGSLIGKHPFMQHISPKKTWEGIGGAMVFSLASGLGLVAILGGKLPLIDWKHGAILGILLGSAAVAGDLAESVVKRSWETKDSGHVLPGIGGTLDLIDSICFGAPVLYFYLRFLG